MKKDFNGFVIFVPGIMGSTLIKTGLDKHGKEICKYVWSADLGINKDILGNNPDLLKEENVIPKEVIKKITLVRKYDESTRGTDKIKSIFLGAVGSFRGIKKELVLYGDLIDFCLSKDVGLGLKDNHNFFTFPYDWRMCNMRTAEIMRDYIYKIDPEKKKEIIFIAHSMGGVIARLLLDNYPDIKSRTITLIQIASPMKGSAKAYYTLKVRPVINEYFDPVWVWEHRRHPDIAHRLMSVINEFSSIYQLLPPGDRPTMYDSDGEPYYALDSNAWINCNCIEQARVVHEILKKNIDYDVKCLFSCGLKTVMQYKIDEYFNIDGTEEQSSKGDGTVLCSSAYAFSTKDQRREVIDVEADHNGICKSKEMLKMLKDIFYEAI
jgi:hypothetical protein